jgi:hypothetical protein
LLYLLQQATGDLLLLAVQDNILKEPEGFADRHGGDLGYGPAAHFHIGCFLAQPLPVAFRAGAFTPVAAEHDPVLYLVLFLLQVLEEAVQPEEIPVAVPYKRLLFRCQLIPGFMYREPELVGTVQKPAPSTASLSPPPAGNGILINRKVFIRDYKCLVNPEHFAVSFAYRAGAKR